MSKPVRIVASAVITVCCAVMVPLLASQMTMTYELPSRMPGGEVTKHVTTFGPAVVGTVVSVILTALAAGWLVWNLFRTPPTKLWVAAGLVLIAAVGTAVFVTGADRPTF